MTGKRLNAAYVKNLLAAQMTNNVPSPNPLAASLPGEYVSGTSVVRLKVMDVMAYERNPRTVSSEKYQEIEDSIAARGLDQQLSVTRRPDTKQYILSRGGKTRLMALQTLVSKGRDDLTYLDFLITPYKGEADLLTAHLVENLAREGMTFMDTARGYMNLRAELTKERGKEIPLREFSGVCKTLGLDAESASLSIFEFAATQLDNVWFAGMIGYREVRDVLRPHKATLETLAKQFSFEISKSDLSESYQEAIQSFKPDEEYSTFNPRILIERINSQVALLFKMPTEKLVAYIAISQDQPGLTATELETVYSQSILSGQQTSSDDSLQDTHQTDGVGVNESDDESSDTTQALSTARAQSSDGSMADMQPGTAYSDALPTGAKYASSDSLVIQPRLGETTCVKPKDEGDSAKIDDTGSQPPLAGMSHRESAAAQFELAFSDLVDQAGIRECCLMDSEVEVGYSVTFPKKPLGTTSSDFAVQAWWFIAHANGQMVHIYEESNSHEEWLEAVSTLLGGRDLGHGYFVIDVLTDIKNPIHQYAVTFMKTLTDYRITTKARKLAKDVQKFDSQTDRGAS